MKVEYRVRQVTRYVVTRWSKADDDTKSHGASIKGEYDNEQIAYEVGYALAKEEHARLGYPLGDERVKYPANPLWQKTVTSEFIVASGDSVTAFPTQ